MATFKLFSPVLDFGLDTLDSQANQILLCSAEPTTYTDASASFRIGAKSFGAGGCFGTPSDYASGRKISSTAITDGTVTTAGTPACWAVIDDANSRLLASGGMSGAVGVVAGQGFSLASFTIDMPRGVAFPLSGANIDLWLSAGRYFETTEGVAVTSYLSCSRASTGYAKNADGTLTSFAANALRIGVGNGLLVEGAATNINPNSQTFSSWSVNGASATDNQAIAPDGTNTADLITETTGTSRKVVYQGCGFSISGNATASVFLKQGTQRYGHLLFQLDTVPQTNWGLVVDLQTGTITETHGDNAPSNTSTSIEAFANGWWRVSATQFANSQAIYMNVGMSNVATGNNWSSGSPSYNVTTPLNIYAWGAQVEAGNGPSSYILTTGASATRAMDSVTMAGSLLTLMSAATFSCFAEAMLTYVQSATIAGVPFIGTHGNWRSPIALQDNDGQVRSSSDDNTQLAGNMGSSQRWSTGARAAFGGSGTGRSLVGGGGTVLTDAKTLSLVSSGFSNWNIGEGNASLTPNAYFRRLAFWNSRLADTTLQSLTAPD